MADREGSIYYRSIKDFDFDKACAFLAQEGISLSNKHNESEILALDDVGDEYKISYEQTKQKALSSNMFNILIWLNYQRKSILTFRLQDNCFVLDFYLGFLFQEERDRVSKAFTKFFLSEIAFNSQSLLGMFIDKNGKTYDYDFDPFFTKDEGIIECFTDLICVPENKLSRVNIDSVLDTVRWLDNDFVCASENITFLEYLLS